MKKNSKKAAGRVVCIGLAGVLALFAPQAAYASAASTQKDETVYVSLDSSGEVVKATVSDWLHTSGDVQQITDKSDLSGIQNVKSNEEPVKTGDDLTWILNADGSDSGGSDIYYEGTTDKTLPLTVSVSYTLDGKQVTADEIAGKTGKVTITVGLKNTDAHTVSVGGENVAMNTPMTAAAVVTLPSDTFTNVSVSDGSLFSDGNNQFAAFLTMPGLSDSLNLKSSGISELSDLDFPEEFTITADAADFTLDSIAVAATPELIDEDDLKNSDDIEEIKTNLNKLKGMQDDIEKADPDKDIRTLFSNPDRTAAARLLVDDVFDFYGLDTKAIDVLPQYITDDNIKLYDRVTSDLDKADLQYLLDDETLRTLNGRVTDASVGQIKKLLSDYDEIETFDMTKLNHVLKISSSYDKNYDKLDDIFSDAERILNRFNKSDIATLSALDSSKVQTKLDTVLDDMQSLGQYSGMLGSGLTTQDYEDIIAVILKNHSAGLSQEIAQILSALPDEDYVSTTQLSKLSSSEASGIADAIQQAVTNGDIEAVIPAATVGKVLTNDITSTELLNAVSRVLQPDSNGNISLKDLQTIKKSDVGTVFSSFSTAMVESLTEQLDTTALKGTSFETNIINGLSLDLENIGSTIENGIFGTETELSVSAFKTNYQNAIAYMIKTYKIDLSNLSTLSVLFPNFNKAAKVDTTGQIQKGVFGSVSSLLTTEIDTDKIEEELKPSVLIEKSSLESWLQNYTAEQLVQNGAETMMTLSTDASSLQSALSDKSALGSDYLSDLSSLRSNLQSQAKNLRTLEADVKDISEDDEAKMEEDLERIKDLLTDKDEMDYLIEWGGKLKGMKADMDGNSDNIALLRDLLKEYDDPEIQTFRSMIPTLQTDLDDSRPILESIKDQLSLTDVNASLHKLPQTAAVLMKTESDIRANRSIMDIFQKTTQPETVALFKSTFETLDDFQKNGSVDDYMEKIDNIEDLMDRKDAYINLSDQYDIFTEAADGADTKLKFVFKTAAIDEPEETPAVADTGTAGQTQAQTNDGGFLGWVRSVWNAAADSVKNILKRP